MFFFQCFYPFRTLFSCPDARFLPHLPLIRSPTTLSLPNRRSFSRYLLNAIDLQQFSIFTSLENRRALCANPLHISKWFKFVRIVCIPINIHLKYKNKLYIKLKRILYFISFAVAAFESKWTFESAKRWLDDKMYAGINQIQTLPRVCW